MSEIISAKYGVKHLVGAIAGVELEIEGVNLPSQAYIPSWRVVRDGSLRDGMEYVIKEPAGALKLRENLKEIEEAFKSCKTKTDYSFRTSTHVHVNVSNLNMEQVKAITVLYYVFENQYTGFCAPSRQGNRFALRLRDAEGISTILRRLVVSNEAPTANIAKYTALNLAALPQYGTLEFRTLEGTDDWERIYTWIRALLRLRKVGRDFGSISAFRELPTKELADMIFNTDRLKGLFLKPGWEQEVEYQRSLLGDVLYAKD